MNNPPNKARTIAITSGKGGVGKTVITANLAYALVQTGNRVLIFEADLGLANLDIIVNLNPDVTLHDVFTGTRALDEVILTAPGGIHVLPAASGKKEYTQVTRDFKEMLVEMVNSLSMKYDYIFFDTGTGISDMVLLTASLADEILIVATQEPTSLTDAYATMKVLASTQNRSTFFLVANHVSNESRAEGIFSNLQKVADQFLKEELGWDVSLIYLGCVLTDPIVEKSVCMRQLFLATSPSTPAAKGLFEVAKSLEASPPIPKTSPMLSQNR